MRIPLRMIGLTTTFFWIFLIAFLFSAVYSVKDLRFEFGEPQMAMSVSNEVIFSLPGTIVNNGLYNVGFFNITTEILDKEDFVISRGTTFVPVIKRNDIVAVTHNMTVDLNDFFERSQEFLFNDTEVTVNAVVSMRLAEMIPVQAASNMSLPWGAPFYGFTMGQPQFAFVNMTHFRVTVPFSFENHAFFDVAGTMQARMFNSADVQVGSGETAVNALQNSPYSGSFEFYILAFGVSSSGRFELFFSTPLFSYGPMVIPYG